MILIIYLLGVFFSLFTLITLDCIEYRELKLNDVFASLIFSIFSWLMIFILIIMFISKQDIVIWRAK